MLTLTLTTLSGSATDSVQLPGSTTLSELKGLAPALLGMDAEAGVTLSVGGRALVGSTLESSGVQDGDLISVSVGSIVSHATVPAPAAQPTSGGLDFSNLLGLPPPAPSPAPSALAAPAPAAASGLSFNIAGLSNAAQRSFSNSATPVSWPGMSVDDLIENNPNPNVLIPLLLSPAHSSCLKELNHHNTALARKLTSLSHDIPKATEVWREHVLTSSIKGAYRNNTKQRIEGEMEARLRRNPMDEEANKYFGEKIRKQNVDAQFELMMEQYPESCMGRILMLYIDCEINGHKFPAFVDSGAQMTVMSEKFADKLGLLHLVDDRFAGVAVGVGNAKILGKVTMAMISIEGHTFPMSVTVMDGSQGLGDKNMDFLLGLDMLRRHRCSINLSMNRLEFLVPRDDGSTKMVTTPFLVEHQLDVSKGGTKGFDADEANKNYDAAVEEAMKASIDDAMKTGDGDGSEEKGDSSDAKKPKTG